MVRKGKRGEFLGCSGYPKCRFTANFKKTNSGELQIVEKPEGAASQETGLVCEKCGKPLVIKRGRRGEFLACSGYPACKNIKNFKRNEKGEVELIDSQTGPRKPRAAKSARSAASPWSSRAVVTGRSSPAPDTRNVNTSNRLKARKRRRAIELPGQQSRGAAQRRDRLRDQRGHRQKIK